MNTKLQIMKIIFFIVIVLLLLPGCYNNQSAPQQEIEELKLEIAELTDALEDKEQQVRDHDTLSKNLNKLMSTVYYGTAVPAGNGREKSFTAFGLFYRDNFYLITAGHCIEYDGIKYTDFKFKPNGRGTLIYPELLYYRTDYENNDDFAIFYDRSVRTGLMVAGEDSEPAYVLGNTERKINFFKEFESATEGESGSPILNSGCKLVGIVIKSNSEYTPVVKVTEALDMIIEQQQNE